MIKDKKKQRIQVREEVTLVRKRQAEYDGGGGRAKRPRLNSLQEAAEETVQKLTVTISRPPIPLSKQTIRRPQSSSLTPGRTDEEEGIDFVHSRRDRPVRLLVRFK